MKRPTWKKQTKVCPICNQEFLVDHANFDKQIYCKKCKREMRKKQNCESRRRAYAKEKLLKLGNLEERQSVFDFKNQVAKISQQFKLAESKRRDPA
jgi:hypothetical protein